MYIKGLQNFPCMYSNGVAFTNIACKIWIFFLNINVILLQGTVGPQTQNIYVMLVNSVENLLSNSDAT